MVPDEGARMIGAETVLVPLVLFAPIAAAELSPVSAPLVSVAVPVRVNVSVVVFERVYPDEFVAEK